LGTPTLNAVGAIWTRVGDYQVSLLGDARGARMVGGVMIGEWPDSDCWSKWHDAICVQRAEPRDGRILQVIEPSATDVPHEQRVHGAPTTEPRTLEPLTGPLARLENCDRLGERRRVPGGGRLAISDARTRSSPTNAAQYDNAKAVWLSHHSTG
jgi:hypothetical protein